MNLPASIEGTGDRDPLPHSLREKAKSVRQEGGAASVEELITTLNQLATVRIACRVGEGNTDTNLRGRNLIIYSNKRFRYWTRKRKTTSKCVFSTLTVGLGM